MTVAIVFRYCRSDKNTTVLAHVFYVVVNKEKIIMKTMEYVIRNKRSDKYLPRVDMWIIDDLHLKKVRHAMLYAMILVKKYFIWNSEFVGSILGCSGKSIQRDVDELFKNGLIEKKTFEVAGRLRWVLCPKYSAEGKISLDKIEEWFRLGEEKVRLIYADGYRYKKRK